MIKKVVVTGGSGFIGKYVCENLQARGIEVVTFDHRKNQDTTIGHFLGDIKSYTDVSEAVALSDGIIHLAGVLGTQETVYEPLPAIETNILGGLNVFKAVRHYNVPAVYIGVGNHWMNNSYSISKTTAERFALMFNKEHKTRIAIVRGLNAYGPRQKSFPVKKIMPNFVLPALKGETITIYGDGTQKMDMIYVEDLADILVRALIVEHGIYNKVFEAGTGYAPTVNEIAQEVINQVKSGKIEHTEMRPGEIVGDTVIGNPETLRPLYDNNLPHFTSLKDGITETISYYRNPAEYEKEKERTK